MRRQRRSRRRQAVVPKINLMPLIDTSLTLLIIFMVTAPMMDNAIKINLPKGQAQEAATDKKQFVVYIDEHKQMYFNSLPIKDEERLLAEIKKAVGSNTDQTVYVKADKVVPYGQVIQVVDQIKVVGGVRYVALATQKHA